MPVFNVGLFIGYFLPTQNVSNGTCEVDLTSGIKSAYAEAGYTNEEIKISISVYYMVLPGKVINDILYTTGEYSEYINPFIYSNRLSVKKISISPESPLINTKNSIYLGKTITPENAYYDSIDWTSSNPEIVSIDSMGKITGVSAGTALITAKIGDVSQTVTVTVYDIISNVTDSEETDYIKETAGDIINSIVNNIEPDLEGTDIQKENIEKIQTDIQEGIKRGDKFFTDIRYHEEKFDKYSDRWKMIQEATNEQNVEFAGAYNIEVEMYHKDHSGKEYHIGNLTELKNDVSLNFDMPTDIKEPQAGYTRNYSLIRIHNNIIEKLDVDISKDGKIIAKSNKYSDFILVYTDVKNSENKNDYELGDVNNDGYINASDILIIKKYILLADTSFDFSIDYADINCNGRIDVLDLNRLIALLLKNN